MQGRRPGYSGRCIVAGAGCRAQVVGDFGIGAAGIFFSFDHPELGACCDHQWIIESYLHAASQVSGLGVKSKHGLPGLAVAVNTLLVDLVHFIGKGLRQAVQRSARAPQHLRPEGQNT